MKTVLLGILILVGFTMASGPTAGWTQEARYINPHIRMDGTYSPGRMSDGSGGNIYLKKNTLEDVINPYTGRIGYKNLYSDYNINQRYPDDIYSYSTYDYLKPNY